jgi:thiol-disulfide isomerase/thioredoxin
MNWSVALWLWLAAFAVSAELGHQPISGIGAALAVEGDAFKVTEIMPDGPAAKDGRLKAGDRLMAVAEGEKEFVKLAGLQLGEVIGLIRGKQDTVVRLQVLPEGAADPADLKVIQLRRAVIPLNVLAGPEDPGALGALHTVAPAASSSPGVATLRWLNGETLSGELLEASEKHLTWKSPLFAEPLMLSRDHLLRVEQQLPAAEVADPFSIRLSNGSHLYGKLVALDTETIIIESTRHGRAVLKRAEVLSVRRLSSSHLITSGPRGGFAWSVLVDGRKQTPGSDSGARPAVPLLETGQYGALVLPYWNSTAGLDLKLPERVDLEFRVRSSGVPEFHLWLGADSDQRLRVETWDGELVLTGPSADRFKSIKKLTDGDREVALRICWDMKTRECWAYTAGGELLADWKVPAGAAESSPGLVLLNKGRDLSLEFLRLRRWDGNPPPRVDLTQPRVELADGRTIEGAATSLVTDTVELSHAGQAERLSVALADIEGIVFQPDPPVNAEPGSVLKFSDGTILMGSVAEVRDGNAALKVPFSSELLIARLEGLHQWFINDSARPPIAEEPNLDQLDTLMVDKTTLRGKFVASDDALPRWLPVGGLKPALLANDLPAEITRTLPEAAPLETPALFYTRAGDVIPGRLGSLDRSGVEIESSIIETKTLSAEMLDAIQFGGAVEAKLGGFSTPGWRVLSGDKGTLRISGEELTMEPGSALGHPSAMHSSDIRFKIAPGGGSAAVRLRMFCAGTERGGSANLVIAHWGTQIYFGMERADGELESQSQMRLQGVEPVEVRLEIETKGIQIYLNGLPLRKYSIDRAKRAGVGLIIEPASIFGNQVAAVSMSDFSAKSAPGIAWVPVVNPEAKMHALTVPRFRKESPPRHALLAANGDVLRGEIESATATHLRFRSGLESLRVPRERLSAAIWLKEPAPGGAAEPSVAPARDPLLQKIGRRTRYSNAGLDTLIKVLEREAPSLKFKLPAEENPRRVAMQFGAQTIGEALDEICALFGVRHSTDEKGVIVIEPGMKTRRGLVQKLHWLRQGALPGDASIQEILTTKGLSFPAGSNVEWRPEAGQLAMMNTAENQEKLSKLVEGELGGSLGSPTHWLTLTNGGQLGLEVENFGAETITGRHVVYGRCHVPVSQVYAVRTFMPDPPPAMKALDGWRLVLAPEPVLPATGGESSPILGKEGQSFKLPLLEGGEFELAKQKGQVVVLDFWATWCGPCIKSLPGLIEAMSSFPADQVKLIGVNQGEPAEQVKRFLDTRGWKLTVAMDAGQTVGRQYGVEGIPHTVIVGPDGKIAWQKTGYSPEAAKETADAVKRLLTPQ